LPQQIAGGTAKPTTRLAIPLSVPTATQPRGRGAAEPRAGTMGRDRVSPSKDNNVGMDEQTDPLPERLQRAKRSRPLEEAAAGAPRGRGVAEPRSGTMAWDRTGSGLQSTGVRSDFEGALKRAKRDHSPEFSEDLLEPDVGTDGGGAIRTAATVPRGRGAAEPRSGTMGRDGEPQHSSGRDANFSTGSGSRRVADVSRPLATFESDVGGEHDLASPAAESKPRGRGAMEPRSGMLGWDQPRPNGMQGADANTRLRADPPRRKSANRKSGEGGSLFRSALIDAANQ
jgi:hypothetical protein